MGSKYDFSGWATKYNIKCSDGRTIREGAFKEQDGQTVPLVYQHCHDSISNVLGHALLKYVPGEGMYSYGSFNETEDGQKAKAQVAHGDITSLSIYANQLKQNGGDVMHGAIREVSLVLAGANIGAVIDNPVLAHGDGEYEDILTEAVIYSGLEQDLVHSENEKSVTDVYNQMTEEQKNVINTLAVGEKPSEDEVQHFNSVFDNMSDDELKAALWIIGTANQQEDEVQHSDNSDEKSEESKNESKDDETVGDILDTLNEKQQKAVAYLLSEALNAKGSNEADNKDETKSNNKEGEDNMKHNVFDNETTAQNNYLSHDDFKTILADAKRCGSLKDAVLSHMEDGVLAHANIIDTSGMEGFDYPTGVNTYGIRDPEMLFPEAKATSATPEWIKRDTDWVAKVVGGAHKSPFSRIKSVFANITADEARAKGYIKGRQKTEEVFTLLKRATTPQTIYKKQKLDRDDIIDITGFDVVAWIKGEMGIMLDEEKARAILIGDGRNSASDDKISPDHIRPIVSDVSLFTIQQAVPAGATDEETAKNVIKGALKARKNYKGSGRPTLFTTEEWLTNMLLIEDGIGHPLYKSEAEVATAMRVSEIVTVPVMEGFKNENGKLVYGIIVNMDDYTIGADKGGQTTLFEDFDIDYNQEKYLIETRMSGALTKPFSAIVLHSQNVVPDTGESS